jgi:DNA polymerase-3 subunit delta'
LPIDQLAQFLESGESRAAILRLPMTANPTGAIRDELRRVRAAGRVHAAYLFDGPAGAGGEAAAFWFARLLLCREPGDDPCERCPDCVRSRPHQGDEARRSGHPDLLVLEPDGPFIKVDAVRGLQRDLALASNEGGWRVGLIVGADRLRTEAANALLKTLEEPRPRTALLLVAERAEALPRTLRSRSARLRFSPESESDVRQALEAGGLQAEDAWLAAALGAGSAERARAWADAHLERAREIALALGQLATGSASEVLDFAERFRGGGDAREQVELFLAVHGALARRRAEEALGRGEPPAAERWAAQFEAGEHARRELVRRNLNPQMVVEGLLVRLRQASR